MPTLHVHSNKDANATCFYDNMCPPCPHIRIVSFLSFLILDRIESPNHLRSLTWTLPSSASIVIDHCTALLLLNTYFFAITSSLIRTITFIFHPRLFNLNLRGTLCDGGRSLHIHLCCVIISCSFGMQVLSPTYAYERIHHARALS
ncbi:hypothetical protein LENED_011090 [Lentinula edodes]|uniref:Uncharacterized protein n=1 Tax=Lentinula edodes TaxID=5353 RepID=A0A1Q3EP51_LENED|nr:hypothetical protein LENED_011090 [Lentinula edodes]